MPVADQFNTEYSARVYDNEHGTYFEIAGDPDGLGLVEIRFVEPGAENQSRSMMFLPESIPQIAEALLRVAKLNGVPNA